MGGAAGEVKSVQIKNRSKSTVIHDLDDEEMQLLKQGCLPYYLDTRQAR